MHDRVWAIPWVADTRLIFYWRSALRQAAIDEATAFSSYDQIERTTARLTASGQRAIVAPTGRETQHTLHNLAPWVWSAGGDFRSASGDRVLFDQPPAREAILRFFRLHRSMAGPTFKDFGECDADSFFTEGKAALTLSGPWVIDKVRARRPEHLGDLGVAALPGIPYTGGSSLVIWGHTLLVTESVDLVRFLAGRSVQNPMADLGGQLSARWDVLTGVTGEEAPLFEIMAEGARRGRTLPGDPLWGLMEARLHQMLGEIWGLVLDPGVRDYEQAIVECLTLLAGQLNRSLASYTGGSR